MFRYTPTTTQPNQPLQQPQQPRQQQQSPLSGLAGLLGQADDVGLIDGVANFFTGGGGGIKALEDVGGAEGAAAGGMSPVASLKAAEADAGLADSGFKDMLSSAGPFGIITGLLNGDQKMTGMWDSIKELF